MLDTTARISYYSTVSLIILPACQPLNPLRLFTLITGLTLLLFPIANAAPADIAKEADTAKEAAKPEQPEKPSIKNLGEHRYQLGDIVFNGKTREIRFPATMNLEKGLLEYVIVTEEGKIHESLLSTKVRPAQLQIAMKLCHYRDGVGDTFDGLLPDDEKKGEKGKANRGSAIKIDVEWKEKIDGIEKMNRYKMDELIRDIKADKPDSTMPSGQWIYTGSIIYEGTFIAESEGTMIAVYIDNGSLINNFRSGSADDERWVTNDKIAPKMGTPVTIILSPDTHEQAQTK